jgi:hypothetical protein
MESFSTCTYTLSLLVSEVYSVTDWRRDTVKYTYVCTCVYVIGRRENRRKENAWDIIYAYRKLTAFCDVTLCSMRYQVLSKADITSQKAVIFMGTAEVHIHSSARGLTDRQTGRQAGRQAGRQEGRQACRQAGRQAGRQAVTHNSWPIMFIMRMIMVVITGTVKTGKESFFNLDFLNLSALIGPLSSPNRQRFLLY